MVMERGNPPFPSAVSIAETRRSPQRSSRSARAGAAHRPPSPANEHFAALLREQIAKTGFIEQEDARRLAETCGASWNSVRLAQWREAHGLEALDIDGKKVWTTTDSWEGVMQRPMTGFPSG